jgi:hypothetical protein
MLLASCGEEVVVRLATRVFGDGSLQRSLELTGRDEDGEVPTEEGWFESALGLRLAEPDAWDSIERRPGRLRAEGFFGDAGALPASLSHETDAGPATDRDRVLLEREDLGVATRWVWRESYGDPFGEAEIDAAVDGLIDLAAEMLREELRRQFGRRVNPAPGEAFLRTSLRDLAREALTFVLREAETSGENARRRRWAEIMDGRGVPVPALVEDEEEFWDAQVVHIFDWLRKGLADALGTPDYPLAAEDLSFLLPAPDEWNEQFTHVAERVWGGEQSFDEKAMPLLGALSGIYGGQGDRRFRFEARLRLPGTLLLTNGTVEGEEIVWFFRDRDLIGGEIVMQAESIELETSALVALGAPRSFPVAELLRLRDLLVERDPERRLAALLIDSLERGGPLQLSEDLPEELAPFLFELSELLSLGE